MTGFLKQFLSGGKSADEKSLLAAQEAERKHDVLRLDLSAYDDAEGDDDICAAPGGCCGGGCRN